MDVFIDFLNWCIKGIGDGLRDFIASIPSICPFNALNFALDSDFLGVLNWFVPISEMISFATIWGAAIVLWYIIRIPLAWLKAKE